MLSVIIPAYNEELSVERAYYTISEILEKDQIDNEIIFISSVAGFDTSNASDFKLLDRKVVDIINRIPERKGFFRAISFWVGFNKTTVEFEVNERLEGE